MFVVGKSFYPWYTWCQQRILVHLVSATVLFAVLASDVIQTVLLQLKIISCDSA